MILSATLLLRIKRCLIRCFHTATGALLNTPVMIHTPKCGGTYLNRQYRLFERLSVVPAGHACFRTLKLTPSRKVIGLIREPVDWYYSYYYFCRKSLDTSPQSITNFPPQHPITVFSTGATSGPERMILNMADPDFIEENFGAGFKALIHGRSIEGLPSFMLRTKCGFWTWTMLYHFSPLSLESFNTRADVLREVRRIRDTVKFIHQENLDEDLEMHLGIPRRIGEKINVSLRPESTDYAGIVLNAVDQLDGDVAEILGGYRIHPQPGPPGIKVE